MIEFKPARAEILPVFATPFLRGMLDLDTEVIANDCRQLVQTIESSPNNAQNYTTYFDETARLSMYDMSWFEDFQNSIKDTYIKFIVDTFNVDVSHLTRRDIHFYAWCSVYRGQHQHEIHNHVNSYMSGTYYVKTGQNTAPIKFLSPNIHSNFSHGARDRAIEREGYHNIVFTGVDGVDTEMLVHPVNNEFLLWPSYMLHSVPPQYDLTQTDNYERISISFNLRHREMIDNNYSKDDLSYGEIFNG